MATLGERLRELRKSRKLSSEQLGEAIGASAEAIRLWESDQRFPRSKYLNALCNYFNVSPSYLMGKADFKNEEETLIYFLLDDEHDNYANIYKRFLGSYTEKQYPELKTIIKFMSLSEKHRQIVSDMIDMYYEKDK